jgi:hypothetical protein
MDLDWIREEIERLRRRWGSLYREREESRTLPAHWALHGSSLHWHVVLEDVLEPDIDVEILPEALVVRARPEADPCLLLVCVLPVPGGFDFRRPRIDCTASYLDIRVRWVGDGADRR